MPNDYSIEIHDYLSQKIKEAESGKDDKSTSDDFTRGVLTELLWVREFIKKNMDLENFKYY